MKKLLTTLLSALLIVMAFGIGQEYYEYTRAQALVHVLASFEVGTTTATHAKAALIPFAKYSDDSQSGSAHMNSQGDSFTFNNKRFSALHLTKYKAVQIGVGYCSGFVSTKAFNFFQEPRLAATASEQVSLITGPHQITAQKDSRVQRYDYGPGLYRLSVSDDPNTPQNRRAKDWDINISCFFSLSSCNPYIILKSALSE